MHGVSTTQIIECLSGGSVATHCAINLSMGQQHKSLNVSSVGLLQCIVLIMMDCPDSKEWTPFIVVVGYLSKYAHFIALKHPFTTHIIAKAFLKEVVRLHDIPSSIIFD